MDSYGRRQPDGQRNLSQQIEYLLETYKLLSHVYDSKHELHNLRWMAGSLFQLLPQVMYELDSNIELQKRFNTERRKLKEIKLKCVGLQEELRSKQRVLNYYINKAFSLKEELQNKTDLTAKPSRIVNYKREIARLNQERQELADALRNKEKEDFKQRPDYEHAEGNLYLREEIYKLTQDKHKLSKLLQDEKKKYDNNFSRWQQSIKTERKEAQTAKDKSDRMEYENKRLRSTLQQTEEKAKRLEERLLFLRIRQTVNRVHEGYKNHEENRVTYQASEKQDFDTNSRLQRQLEDTRGQLKDAQKELQDVKTRLSRVMGDRLTDNNPNIADLSDRNRPTKISERYQELYDNQWTDAFETIDRTFRNEEKTVSTLKTILLDVMDFCKEEVGRQWAQITFVFAKRMELPTDATKQLKDCRRMTAEVYGAELLMEYLNSSTKEFTSVARQIPDFVKECVQICWLMVVQNPPLVFGPETGRHALFDKDHYKTYTKSGERVAFVVWPVLLLHLGGPVLTKGVAQGTDWAHSYPPMGANLKHKTNIVHPLQSGDEKAIY